MKKFHVCFVSVLCAIFICVSAQAQVTVNPVGTAVSLNADQEETVGIILTNHGDQAVEYRVDFNKPPDPEGRRLGPRRDDVDLEGFMFAVFQDNQAYNWLSEQMVGPVVDDEQMDSYRNGNDWNEVEFEDYDVIVLAAGGRQGFANQYNDNYERFCEYIDGGGAAYFETHDPNSPIHSPGDIVNDIQHRTESGTLVVSPDPEDDNYSLFAEICHASQEDYWEEGEAIEGNAWLHSAYSEDQFADGVEDGTLDWYQVLANASNGQPGAIAYGYGAGACLVLGHPTGHTWTNWVEDGQWGSIAGEILFYLTGIVGPKWLISDPEEGEIPAQESVEVSLAFLPLEMEEGVYEMRVVFEMDPGDIEISAVLSVDSPAANLSGVVLDETDGQIIEGVSVNMDRYVMTRFTDEDGAFSFNNLPPNAYELTFTAPDYLPLVAETAIENEDNVELEVSLLHSECNPDIENVVQELAPDSETELSFDISNDGNGPLTYHAERRLLGDANAEPWTARVSHFVGEDRDDTRIQGVVYIEDQFFVAGANNNEPAIYIYDHDGNYVDQFAQPGDDNRGMKDLAWDGTLIWGAVDEILFGFTTAGEVITSFEGPFNPTTNITWDPINQWLWTSSTTSNFVAVDLDGNLRAEINRGALRTYGLAFWSDDPDNSPLYIFAKEADTNRPVVHKVNLGNGQIQLVAYLDSEMGGTPAAAFITNQYDIYSWVMIVIANTSADEGGDRVDIWQVDARKEWMQLDPMEGVIEGGETQEFTLVLDATDLPAELFEGELVFMHDGVGSVTHIPISLNVVAGPVHTVQTLELNIGWNMVSAYLQPDEVDVEVLTQDLVDADNLLMMKNSLGNFYNPEYGFNNIPGWNVAEGYLIKMRQAGELPLEGTTVMADEPIAVVEGWQMVSYYPRIPVNAIVALSGLGESLIMAKDGNGNFYNRQFGFSNMGDMMAGRGYLLKLAEDAELVYRLQAEEELAAVYPQRSVYTKPGKLPVHAATGSNMSLLVKSNKPGEVGVYVQDELVGSGILENGTCGIAVWGDDPTTDGVDGARPGDALTVKLLSEDNLQDVEYDMLTGDGTWQADGFQAIEISGLVEVPTEFGISAVYPNPFNSSARISYSLERSGHIELALFDLSGRQVSTLLIGNVHAGSHVFNLDGSSLTSGVYVAQLSADGQISRMKVTLIK